MRFRNHYRCPCGCTWSDVWSATCDDRCPRCNSSCEPVESEDLDPLAGGNSCKPVTEASNG